MSESGAVDAAVFAALRADAALMALIPSGFFYDVASGGAVAFGIVKRQVGLVDDTVYDEAAGETYQYLVKVVIPGTSSEPARQGAARIRAVLDGNATLAPAGFRLMRPTREVEAEPRYTEVAAADPDRRVHHWGGQYEVVVQRTA